MEECEEKNFQCKHNTLEEEPKSCSCRWGPCPRPIPRLACLFSFFLSFEEAQEAARTRDPAGGGGVAERGRGERRDRRRSDKGKNDESGWDDREVA